MFTYGLKKTLFFVFAYQNNIRLITFFMVLLVLLITTNIKSQQTAVLPTPLAKNLLFFLQCTPNTSTVIYEINFKKDGTIDKQKPVVGTLIRHQEDQKHKPLTVTEQRFFYGIKCIPLGKNEFEIRLAAYQKMPLYLLKSTSDNTYKTYIKNGSENLLLKRVFVKVKKRSFWFQKVQYIDLITAHSEKGKGIIKRITI